MPDMHYLTKFLIRTDVLIILSNLCAFAIGYIVCFIKLRVVIKEVE